MLHEFMLRVTCYMLHEFVPNAVRHERMSLGCSPFARHYSGNQGLCPKIQALKGEEFLATKP